MIVSVPMKQINRSWKIVRVFGFRELMLRIHARLFPVPKLSIYDVAASKLAVTRDVRDVVSKLCFNDFEGPKSGELLQIYLLEWHRILNGIQSDLGGSAPVEWDVEKETAKALYALVRAMRPKTALETGIARGQSSLAILSAMEANGYGELHSCDVEADTGQLVHSYLHGRWHRHLIDGRRPKESFSDLVRDLPAIDLFFHDSNHREAWMRFEFETVLPRMGPGAVIGADDVEQNRAVLSAAEQTSYGLILLDSRKASFFANLSA